MKNAPVIGSSLLIASALCAIVLDGCMESKLASSWPEGEISIDGKAPEWAGREAYYSENDGFKIGFFNDADYLYVYMATWNRQKQSQILMNGLTVWIDATGRKKQSFGINYPMKRTMPDSTGTPMGMPAGLRHGARSNAPSDASGENPQIFLRSMLEDARGEMTILGLGDEPITSMPAADDGKGGLAAMIDIANRTLIYEARIPLAPSDSLPFAVNAVPGAMISVGFKVGKMEMPPLSGAGRGAPEGMSPGGGGMGGPGGGMGGPGGGMGGPGGPGGPSSQALEYWAKVRLASARADAPLKEPAEQKRH